LALQDISLAFIAGYPLDLAYKLHERRSKCLKELGDYKSSELSAKECIEAIAEAKLDNEKKEKFRENVKKFMNDLPKEPNATESYAENESSLLLPKITTSNKQFPAFSDAIELKHEEGRGRFGVASRDIKLGKKFVTSANTMCSTTFCKC
jgi:hypothetical protein